MVEGILFQGTIYGWFLSCPLLIILEFTTTDKNQKHILMSSTKFSSPKQVEGHSSYVLHLIHEDSFLHILIKIMSKLIIICSEKRK